MVKVKEYIPNCADILMVEVRSAFISGWYIHLGN